MSDTATPKQYPYIDLPTGAAAAEEWGDVGKPDAFRIFTGPRRTVGNYYVEACGTQSIHGSIDDLYIRTNLHGDDEISGTAARQLAKAFVWAADDLDRLASSS